MSVDQFHEVTDYDERFTYELVQGAVFVSPFPETAERAASQTLAYRLREFQEHHRNGNTLIETVYFHYLSVLGNERLAHRVIWTKLDSREMDPRRSFPTIVVDLLSNAKASRFKHLERRDEYFAAGACEYWLFDRSSRSMIVYSQFEGVSRETLVKDGDTYSTKLLPGFNLRLADMFAAADQWAAKE